jgi:hypothetical protein
VTEGEKSRERKTKAGTARWLDAATDVQIENLGDKPTELILVELKGAPSGE